jgi:hypothetical protein
MRTLIVVAVGIILSLAFVYAAGALGKGRLAGAAVFLIAWLVFCVVDFMKGVKAGYTPVDELGIHILLFTVPAISSWLGVRFLP